MTLPQVEIHAAKDMGDRVWGTELLIAEGPGYIGKLMYMQAGKAGGLQSHVEKHETSYLLSGRAWVYTDTGDGALSKFQIGPGTSVRIPPGAVHKVEAIEDCCFFEASTKHFNDRVRLEEKYGRTDTEGLPTTGVQIRHYELPTTGVEFLG